MKFPFIAIGLMVSWSLMTSAEVRILPIAVNDHVPLGFETFRIGPGKQYFYLMASAESPSFNGMRRVTAEHQLDRLIDRHGKRMMFYPHRVNFRLTASSRDKMMGDPPWDLHSTMPLSELLLKLHFRLKIFHGLAFHYVQPLFVKNIGMPSDLPSDERIYRIGFDMGTVPITDRIVIEVLEPSGERLCKFHLDIL